MTPTGAARRLPAAERRQAVVEAALGVFAARSYAGATTAEIAREAGVSEPILYRHFGSKRDLYLACLDEAWARLRDALDAKVEELGEAAGVRALGEVALRMHELRILTPNLWLQGLSAAGEDDAIRRHLRRHMREVHEHVAGILRAARDAGGMPADRDPDAEAWIFIAGGLLVTVADRLGGVLEPEDFEAIGEQRRRWLTGAEARADAPASARR
jgi:AcrR family transcriptional regulator